MKIILIISCLFLAGCQTATTKPDLKEEYDFYFYDLISGESTGYDDDLDLRIKVSTAQQFTNRQEQIQWALGVTSLALNLDLSDYDFKNEPPSPYLGFNKIISVKQYLRLAGFRDQAIIIDKNNKVVVYLRQTNPFFVNKKNFTTLSKQSQSERTQIDQNLEIKEQKYVAFSDQRNTNNKLTANINGEGVGNDSKNENQIRGQSDSNETSIDNSPSLDSDDPVADESLSLTVEKSTVIENVGPPAFHVESGLSLREIFTKLGQFYNLDFVSSLGRYDWFLNSTINHDYEFNDLDHALLLILKESNTILSQNNMGFLLKASVNNGILDLYYD